MHVYRPWVARLRHESTLLNVHALDACSVAWKASLLHVLLKIHISSALAEVTISGTPHSLSLAVSMVTDIVKGTFKGFALLRQITNPGGARAGPLANPMAQPRPVYAPGYGLIPPSQVRRVRRCQG
jgi:hypothetical protein